MNNEEKLKAIIFYQDKIKKQLKSFYVKDAKVFSKEYGRLSLQEALYKAKIEELHNICSFKESFENFANELIKSFFEQKNGKILSIEEALNLMEMQEEYDYVAKLNAKQLQEFYNINRLKADKLIFEAAIRINHSDTDKISMLNKITELELRRLIENYDEIEDLKSSIAVLEIMQIAKVFKQLLSLYINKNAKFSLQDKNLAEIETLLLDNKINFTKSIQDNKIFIYIQISSKSLLNNISHILSNAMQPPLPNLKKIDRAKNYLDELRSLSLEQISTAQLAE